MIITLQKFARALMGVWTINHLETKEAASKKIMTFEGITADMEKHYLLEKFGNGRCAETQMSHATHVAYCALARLEMKMREEENV